MKIQPPALPAMLPADLSPEVLAERASREEEDITGLHFRGGASPAAFMARAEFRGCLFENWQFRDAVFERTDFTDCVFRGCDFSGSRFTGCGTLRCRWEECKAVGADLTGLRLWHFTAEEGNFRYANFAGVRMKAVAFAGCDLTEAVLAGCDLGKAALTGCRMQRCNVSQTPLAGIDLTTDDIDGLLLTGGELKNAVVTTDQAAQLARLFGVVIRG